jgi:hypothetical protein
LALLPDPVESHSPQVQCIDRLLVLRSVQEAFNRRHSLASISAALPTGAPKVDPRTHCLLRKPGPRPTRYWVPRRCFLCGTPWCRAPPSHRRPRPIQDAGHAASTSTTGEGLHLDNVVVPPLSSVTTPQPSFAPCLLLGCLEARLTWWSLPTRVLR